MDFNRKEMFGSDYLKICGIFKNYRLNTAHAENWKGILITSDEFIRGMELGTNQTIRKKTIGTQTESYCQRSPSLFSSIDSQATFFDSQATFYTSPNK